jgi:hypothetical protein
LRHVYSDAVVEKYGFPEGWMANWPAGTDRMPGDVGTIQDDGESFNKDGVLADYGITAEPAPPDSRPDGGWEYTSSSDIKLDIGVDASTPGMDWIGNAKAGVKIGFGQEKGLVVAIASAHGEGLANIDGLKQQLLDAARSGRIEVGKAIIVQQLVADSGLIITSDGNSGELAATTNVDVGGAGKPTLASFAADFDVAHKSQAVSENAYPNGFTVAFRVLKLGKRGWFWWRHITIEGITDVTEVDEESLLTPDDYWALMPDAEFSGAS